MTIIPLGTLENYMTVHSLALGVKAEELSELFILQGHGLHLANRPTVHAYSYTVHSRAQMGKL